MSRESHSVLSNEKASFSHDRRRLRLSVRPPRRTLVTALAALALLVILALALGLGLGLGLDHRHSKSASADSASTFPDLQSTPSENFYLNGLQGQQPQTRVYDFVISQVQGAPDGVSKPMLVVNGMYPGPTIEANQGDRLIVNVTNQLENRTTIHWHGLFQNGTNFYDGTMGITECGIPPGQSLVYNFTFGEFSGTTWWHAHYNTQYTDGVTGALIVYPSDPSPSSFPTWDEEIVVQLADLYHTFSSILLEEYLSPVGVDGTPGDEPVPDSGTINGLGQWNGGGSYFNFTLQPNKTYRLRLVNTGSFGAIRFSIDSHPLDVIEVDGTLVQPYRISGVNIAVAQRYSVLVHTNASTGANVGGAFWVRAELQADMFAYDVPGQNLDVRGVLRYGTNDTSLPQDIPDPGLTGLGDLDSTQLVPAVVDAAPARTRAYPLTISLQNTADNRFLAFMNTTSWEPLMGTTTLLQVFQQGNKYAVEGGSLAPSEQFVITEDSIQVIDLQIDNLDDGDHPFHLHGHRPWIMGSGLGRYTGQALNATNPLRRDTVLIPAYSWTVLRFVTDNPGLWAFHCHLAWHMAAGLLMQINSLPSVVQGLTIPQSISEQCNT